MLQIFLAFKTRLARKDLQTRQCGTGKLLCLKIRGGGCHTQDTGPNYKPTQFLPAPRGLCFTLNRAMLNI